MMNLLLFYLLIFTINTEIESANILCLMGVNSPSHHIWNSAITNALADKGHNLTILSADIEKNTPSNINYIHLEELYNTMYNGTEALDLMEMANENVLSSVFSYHDFGYIECKGIIASKGFQTLLNYPKDFKFDLVIFDFTCGPCILGFLEKFNFPPMIGVSAFNNPPMTRAIIGGHKYYAYIPFYSLSYSTNMNFFQRLFNTLLYALDDVYRYYVFLPTIDKQMKKAYGQHLSYAGDLETRAKILLVNSHPSIDFPEPTPPNIIQVGGLQIRPPKPIPKDMLEFIESSKKGTILFSLGSNVRSDQLVPATQKLILEVFKELPEYNFLWKFESDKLPMKLPKNVMIKPWVPQSNILPHKNIKAFFTHGGLLSMHEATWYGVPMIIMPFFADQHRNSYMAIRTGTAEKVLFQSLEKESLKRTILKVLQTPSYKENIEKRAKYFHDQPQKPLDLAVWWIEWVLRNPDADFMESPTKQLGFIRSNLYDIIFFVIFTPILFIYIIKKLCCNRKTEDKKIKNLDKKNK